MIFFQRSLKYNEIMKLLIFILITLVVLGVGTFFVMGGTSLWQDDLASYGGKTPAETMDLLISALKADDVELASKYFMPEMVDGELNIEKWEDAWGQAKSEGRLSEIIDLLEEAQPNPEDSSYSGDFKYVVVGDDGMAINTIDMKLFDEGGVWKIESL